MWNMWLKSLALSLGLAVTMVQGQEGAWHATPPQAAITEPIPIAVSQPLPTQPATSAAEQSVTIHKPIPIARPALREDNLQPAAYRQSEPRVVPLARGAAPDNGAAPLRPMPQGPNIDPGMAGLHNWRKPDQIPVSTTALPTAQTASGNAPVLPAPTPVNPPLLSGVAPTTGNPPAVVSPSLSSGTGVVVPPGPVIAPGTVVGGPIAQSDCSCSGTQVEAPIQGGLLSGGVCNGPNCLSKGCGMGSCGSGCCGGGFFKGHDGPRWNLSAEYLMWWLKADNTPALLNQGATFQDTFLNSPTAITLYGGSGLGEKMLSGFRLNATYWFTDAHCWGIDVGGFLLAEMRERYSIASTGSPALGRPYFDVSPPGTSPRAGQNSAEVVADTGIPGTFTAIRKSSLWGYEINLRKNCWCSDWFYCDMVFGYRQIGMNESLNITEVVNNNLIVNDRFATENRFYGGQIGFDTTVRIFPAWTINLRTRLGMGCTHQLVDISGYSVAPLNNGIPATVRGGLLTAPDTNIGRFTRKEFGVIPEVGLTLGYDITDWCQIFGGYNFLYWNSVLRPGEQINLNVNTTRAFGGNNPFGPQGALEPSQRFMGSNFFAHGVSLGLLFRF